MKGLQVKSEKEKRIKSIRKELKVTECDVWKTELRMKLKNLKKEMLKVETVS